MEKRKRGKETWKRGKVTSLQWEVKVAIIGETPRRSYAAIIFIAISVDSLTWGHHRQLSRLNQAASANNHKRTCGLYRMFPRATCRGRQART